MDEKRQDDQLKRTYNSSVSIRDVALETSWDQWTIETVGQDTAGELGTNS